MQDEAHNYVKSALALVVSLALLILSHGTARATFAITPSHVAMAPPHLSWTYSSASGTEQPAWFRIERAEAFRHPYQWVQVAQTAEQEACIPCVPAPNRPCEWDYECHWREGPGSQPVGKFYWYRVISATEQGVLSTPTIEENRIEAYIDPLP